MSHNIIDKNVFKPTLSDFREKHNLKEKVIVLGAANVWGKRKQLDDFYRLSQMLPNNYAIVLVGLAQKK